MKKITMHLLVILFIVVFSGCEILESSKKGEIYYLPGKYAGWVCVSFNVEGAPPLPEKDGFLIVTIPPDGILKTSTKSRVGPKSSEYYYYSDKGVRKATELQLGGGGTIGQEGKEIMFHFWVSNGDRVSDYIKYINGRDPHTIECGPWRK
jgi:hypothetical protein